MERAVNLVPPTRARYQTYTSSRFREVETGARPLNVRRLMSIVLWGYSDFQLRMHQKPFVGRAVSAQLGEPQRFPDRISRLGRALERVERMEEGKGVEVGRQRR